MEQETTHLPESVRRVAQALKEKGIAAEIQVLEQSARTAQEAAEAVGCAVGQIVKSLVFTADDRPFVALVSGENRVDLGKLERLLQARVRRATAAEAKEATGYAIGGVPPLGHATPMPILIDETLLAYPRVWAAAGHSHSVFAVEPAELVRACGGRVVDLKEDNQEDR